MYPVSDAFLAAIASQQKWDLQVLVKTAAGVVLEDITEDIVAGSVSVDETREIRRTCSLTLKPSSDIIPEKSSDLLHPATAHELWISRGVEYPNGSNELVPLGVFRLSKPNIKDSGNTLGFTIGGNDRASVVARQGWQTPYQVLGGSNPSAVIQTVLEKLIGNIYPDMDFSTGIQIANFLFPTSTWGVTAAQQTDPMSDLQTFAAGPGFELFFDVLGNPVFRQIINPATAAVNDAIHFVNGENCTMLTAERTLDETIAYNGVKLWCNGPGSAGPFVVTVWDTNPDSETYYLGPWGQVFYPMTTTLIPAGTDPLVPPSPNPSGTTGALAKANLMAAQQLQLILGAMDTVDLTTVPNPALQEGDVLTVQRDRIKIASNYVISQMTIPLDPQSAESISFRPQVSTS